MRKQVELLEDHAGLPTDLLDLADVIVEFDPVDHHPAAVVLLQAIDAANQRALAGAGRPDDDHDLLPHLRLMSFSA